MKKKLITIFWLFIIFSVLGCVYETFLCFFQRGYFESRQGLVYGMFTPVYGIGAVCFYIFLKKIKNIYCLFLVGMLLGGVVEYLTSLIQELAFNTISWNYTKYFLNFNGRTSIIHMLFWGLLGVLFMKGVLPIVLKTIVVLVQPRYIVITYILFFFMCFDVFISSSAAVRQKEREKQIAANSGFDYFLDRHYDDKYMNKIYPNRMVKR